MFHRIVNRYLSWSRPRVLGFAGILFGAIATLDFFLPAISLDLFYSLPVVFASGFLTQSQIVALAALSSAVRELFAPAPVDSSRLIRTVAMFLTFLASGLFVSELSRNRRASAAHVRELQEQMALRKEAQDQLSVLIETSPAGILIIDAAGLVLMANGSAEQIFGFTHGRLAGERIGVYLPAIDTVPVGAGRRSLRSNLECRGHRRNGSVFLAEVWFSTYSTASGPRIAAIVLDASEGLRDREGAGLESLMRTSRVVMGAVSHSVRNLCAASKMAYENLARVPALKDNEDMMALGTVLRGLENLAENQLHQGPDRPVTMVDLNSLIDELRVVIEPSFEEDGVDLVWSVEEGLPPVIGDHYGLLHAFLNLTRNSGRALSRAAMKRFEVRATSNANGAEVAFIDTAGGVAHPEALFQPFQPGASGTGLGLYVSRALVRSFDGELQYEPAPGGSRFSIRLRTAYDRNNHATTTGGD
ncbi:MAG: PAS domain S-box protein [Acidobacteria bacterium]|nr:PAS domain S-box protein [Acidobacteriota bacterium]